MKSPSLVLARSGGGKWQALYVGDDADGAFNAYESAVTKTPSGIDRLELHVRGEFRRRFKIKDAPEESAATPSGKRSKKLE